MTKVNEEMDEIRSTDWLQNTRWTEVTRVNDGMIEVQMSRIRTEGLTNLHEMNSVEINRIEGAMGDKITIVLEVQQ